MLSNVKMAETIETMPETTETIPEKEEAVSENPHVEPTPKKRGRPKGAPDKAPRKKKIVIVEEAVVRKAPERAQSSHETPPPRQAEPVVVHAPPPEPPQPPSPRTTLREASQHILQLQNLRDTTRRAHLGELFTRKLHRL